MKQSITDTHCHIYLEDFRDDLNVALDRAAGAGVNRIFMPAINFQSTERMREMHHPGIEFFSMTGIHPCEVKPELIKVAENRLYDDAGKDEFVAVGETGLDYHWSTEFVSEQKRSFNLHCEVAKAARKPIILHNRKATSDLLNIIEQQQDGSLSGIWHCFNGTEEEGRRALDLNLYLGIGGVLTFKNAGVDKTVSRLPLDRMVLETDAPYLAPHPNRGKRNEPSFIKFTAERLAEVMDCPPEEVVRVTSRNAERVFRTITS
ncbi:MAG: TatD family hydrolase [Balneolales bacterium]